MFYIDLKLLIQKDKQIPGKQIPSKRLSTIDDTDFDDGGISDSALMVIDMSLAETSVGQHNQVMIDSRKTKFSLSSIGCMHAPAINLLVAKRVYHQAMQNLHSQAEVLHNTVMQTKDICLPCWIFKGLYMPQHLKTFSQCIGQKSLPNLDKWLGAECHHKFRDRKC